MTTESPDKPDFVRRLHEVIDTTAALYDGTLDVVHTFVHEAPQGDGVAQGWRSEIVRNSLGRRITVWWDAFEEEVSAGGAVGEGSEQEWFPATGPTAEDECLRDVEQLVHHLATADAPNPKGAVRTALALAGLTAGVAVAIAVRRRSGRG